MILNGGSHLYLSGFPGKPCISHFPLNAESKHWLSGDSPEEQNSPPSRGRGKPFWITLLPWVLILGAILVFIVAFYDRFVPGTQVTVATAIARPSSEQDAPANSPSPQAGKGQMLFQATGWVEPDPLPIRVTSLYSGVVAEVHVLEGQSVTNGQLIATLIEDDAQLELRAAQVAVAQSEAGRNALKGELQLSKARKETAIKHYESSLAQLGAAKDNATRLRQLKPGTIPERELIQANLQEQANKAEAAAANAKIAEWDAEASRLEKEITVQQQRIQSAMVMLDQAKLALSRTKITAPCDGIVLRLLTTPGKRMMINMDREDAGTAVIMYQPDHLQVRVDVPLADAAGLSVGQSVRLSSSLLPNQSFDGEVTRIVGEADLQRNTLQAKVRILNPDPRLRPEMLCRAEFFGNRSSSSNGLSSNDSGGALMVFIPKQAIQNHNGQSATVWALTQDESHAESRSVTIGSATDKDWQQISEGIRPGDRVIIDPPPNLKSGDRVRPISNAKAP